MNTIAIKSRVLIIERHNMTVHQEIIANNPVEERSLARLRMRQAALRQQAQQLQARAEHLERVGRGHLERYARRVDAHEKIVLGSLVKKAGLDFALSNLTPDVNDAQTTSIDQGLAAQSTLYDRELILGVLLWLASALNRPENDVVSLPNRQRLRQQGHEALHPAREREAPGTEHRRG